MPLLPFGRNPRLGLVILGLRMLVRRIHPTLARMNLKPLLRPMTLNLGVIALVTVTPRTTMMKLDLRRRLYLMLPATTSPLVLRNERNAKMMLDPLHCTCLNSRWLRASSISWGLPILRIPGCFPKMLITCGILVKTAKFWTTRRYYDPCSILSTMPVLLGVTTKGCARSNVSIIPVILFCPSTR